MSKQPRQAWGSRLGIILAVAGSAVGLGNFLRFPVQAATNGGGAFMIPYFISILLLGIPLMWVEWTIGRYGGWKKHGTAPGAFAHLWPQNKWIKYFGITGIFGPLVIYIYYVYIESWLLAYAWFALTGAYQGLDQAGMQSFLSGYQGLETNTHFSSLGPAYLFFLLTLVLNMWVLSRGIDKGIETLCKITMPVLLVMAIIVAVRVLTLGAVDPLRPDWNPINGLGFLWNADLSALKDAKVWLAAAGQVFFTLSVGIGSILTYASYLNRKQDIALSGLTSVSTNEFAEVILGASIVIPAAFVFFGPHQIGEVAAGGAFNLGFITMPLIFQQIPWGQCFAFLWFFLLFLAGLTSSVSLMQPAITFLEEDFQIPRKYVVMILGFFTLAATQPIIFFLANGVLDEMDFWGGTFCLVLFGTVEAILFAWVFGIDKGWKELHEGAEIQVPRIYKFIIKYVTPVFLLIILGSWFIQNGLPVVLMEGVSEANRPFVLATRFGLIALFGLLCGLLYFSVQQKAKGRKKA